MSRVSLHIFLLLIIFSSCKKDDNPEQEEQVPVCEQECLNGGECIDGECDCPPGYIGTNCSTFTLPTTITIDCVRVNKFPPLNSSGNNYDPVGFGNDQFPELGLTMYGLYYSTAEWFHNGNQYIENAHPDSAHVFTANPALELKKGFGSYSFEYPYITFYLTDNDASTSEFIFQEYYWLIEYDEDFLGPSITYNPSPDINIEIFPEYHW